MSVVDGVDGFSGAGVLRLSGVDVDSETVGCFSGGVGGSVRSRRSVHCDNFRLVGSGLSIWS